MNSLCNDIKQLYSSIRGILGHYIIYSLLLVACTAIAFVSNILSRFNDKNPLTTREKLFYLGAILLIVVWGVSSYLRERNLDEKKKIRFSDLFKNRINSLEENFKQELNLLSKNHATALLKIENAHRDYIANLCKDERSINNYRESLENATKLFMGQFLKYYSLHKLQLTENERISFYVDIQNKHFLCISRYAKDTRYKLNNPNKMYTNGKGIQAILKKNSVEQQIIFFSRATNNSHDSKENCEDYLQWQEKELNHTKEDVQGMSMRSVWYGGASLYSNKNDHSPNSYVGTFVLESTNPTYKDLVLETSQIFEELRDIRKHFDSFAKHIVLFTNSISNEADKTLDLLQEIK
ncbi:hypothetical protein [Akkermansia muciniphila]|uniref:hypothetical protein n=1 Tax=Akkermansia muciniphila TaxID=239935 RepID=UPI001968B8CC|nr:hypothetical protein [Akkermansia muciniphila]